MGGRGAHADFFVRPPNRRNTPNQTLKQLVTGGKTSPVIFTLRGCLGSEAEPRDPVCGTFASWTILASGAGNLARAACVNQALADNIA